ncbi:hypothetical protein [uncultured Paracoccus sp.]|uniref:hypothetical protein n=1 Tax=uncultured Paracoccus sp. TaxID=189685 RepID=UPI0026266EAD|nr:hypothetical protein [uncultured Paracoccus sp.]
MLGKGVDLCAGRRRLIGRIFGRADLDQLKALPLNWPGLVSFKMKRRSAAFLYAVVKNFRAGRRD